MYISNHDFYIIDHLASHVPTDFEFWTFDFEVLRPPSSDSRPYSMLFDWLVDNPKNPSINRVPGLHGQNSWSPNVRDPHKVVPHS